MYEMAADVFFVCCSYNVVSCYIITWWRTHMISVPPMRFLYIFIWNVNCEICCSSGFFFSFLMSTACWTYLCAK